MRKAYIGKSHLIMELMGYLFMLLFGVFTLLFTIFWQRPALTKVLNYIELGFVILTLVIMLVKVFHEK